MALEESFWYDVLRQLSITIAAPACLLSADRENVLLAVDEHGSPTSGDADAVGLAMARLAVADFGTEHNSTFITSEEKSLFDSDGKYGVVEYRPEIFKSSKIVLLGPGRGRLYLY